MEESRQYSERGWAVQDSGGDGTMIPYFYNAEAEPRAEAAFPTHDGSPREQGNLFHESLHFISLFPPSCQPPECPPPPPHNSLPQPATAGCSAGAPRLRYEPTSALITHGN